MAQPDVYAAARDGRLFVDVRADTLRSTSFLVLIPLVPCRIAPDPVAGLNPTLVLGSVDYQLMTQLVASVPRKGFGSVVDTLEPRWDDILRALDFLFTGL